MSDILTPVQLKDFFYQEDEQSIYNKRYGNILYKYIDNLKLYLAAEKDTSGKIVYFSTFRNLTSNNTRANICNFIKLQEMKEHHSSALFNSTPSVIKDTLTKHFPDNDIQFIFIT